MKARLKLVLLLEFPQSIVVLLMYKNARKRLFFGSLRGVYEHFSYMYIVLARII